MASNFPSSLDSYATLTDNTDDVLAAHPNDRGDAIENLEAKVGVNSSAVTTSHDYLLTHLPGQVQNWDAGSYEVRSQTFQSDVTTGTAPLIVASTTKVTNLNADLLDGQTDTYYTNASNLASGTVAIARGGTGLSSISAANRVLLSTDGSAFTTGRVDLATTQIQGNLPVGNLNSGTGATSTSFWRGDAIWSRAVVNELFTSSGTFTAPSGVTKVYLSMIAGGGGGGSGTADSGGGGAAGQCVLNYPYTVIAGNNYTVTIGAGGGIGTTGGASVFDTLTLAGGISNGTDVNGGLALSVNGATGVNGGAGGKNTVPIGNGGNGRVSGTIGGGGGGTPFGAGGAGGADGAPGNSAAANTGAGGGGGGSSGQSGGSGGSGICIVMY